jgi:hypothetical protein
LADFPMQRTAVHDTASSERHHRARSATTLANSPAARAGQHVATSHVVSAHKVSLDCVPPERHCHGIVDISRRNVSVRVHAPQSLNQFLFERVDHCGVSIDTVGSLCKRGGRRSSADVREPSGALSRLYGHAHARCDGRSQARSRAKRLRSASEQCSRAPS